VDVYSLAATARILRVSPARLRYWERTALVRPSVETGGQPAFGFHDLVTLRALVALVERGVSLQRIRGSVQALSAAFPDLDQPLRALRVWGKGQVVARHGGALIQPDGQLVLDFDEPGGPAREVAALPQQAEEVAAASRSAAEWFERACELDGAPATLGEAEAAYRRALDADPAFADAHCNLGTLYFNQGRRDLARECYERALAEEPDHLEANFNLASLLEEQGRREGALHHYKCALRANPAFAEAHLNLALLYEKLGLHRKAREHWRRYLGLVPDGAWAEVARQRLQPPETPAPDA
jgi:tetratricopeptide (TPR) repeat protein